MFIGIGIALQGNRKSGPPLFPPVNTVAPVISGTATEGSTLTSTQGTWSPAGTTYAYQWKRGATNVGTNANTYVLQAGDVGANMTCVVTATNTDGSASATSNSLGPVAAAPVVLVPEMTSNTAPAGYVASASSVGDPANFPEWEAFNSTLSVFWKSDFVATPHWLRIQLPSAATATAYAVTSSNTPDRTGSDFSLQGSNDGSSWSTLDTRTGQTWAGGGVRQQYSITTPGSYTYYRLLVTALSGGETFCQIARLELLA